MITIQISESYPLQDSDSANLEWTQGFVISPIKLSNCNAGEWGNMV